VQVARVLVVAASPASRPAADVLAARLGPPAVVQFVRTARSTVDREQVDVCLVATDDVSRQRDTVRQLKSMPVPLPVLVEHDVMAPTVMTDLLRAGADGFVAIDLPIETLRRCLAAAAAGELVLTRSDVRHLATELRLAGVRIDRVPARLRALSDREREVVMLLYAGLTTAEVAARLVVTPATVRSHLHAAQRKLRAPTRDHVFQAVDGV
jgi:RNA polymerase sigma factor (sigma-70 family)